MPEQEAAADYRHLMNRLADELVAKGAITTPAVERAFRTVPRHLFIDRGKLHLESGDQEIVCDH